MKNLRPRRRRYSVLAAAALLVPLSSQALPLEFERLGIKGSFDTTISLGTSIRAEDPDPSLYGITNGGTARSVNDDDGNLNYSQWDAISFAAKATHEVDLRKGNFGLFSRFTYFYDGAATNEESLGPGARDRLVKSVQLLDFVAAGIFEVGDRELWLRAGKQVVNWGESTFIGNSINSINPIDVAKLRTPGSEIKEALIASPMLWSSFGVTDSISAEAFWLLSFDEVRIDPRNAYFSTNDFISDDGDKVYVAFGRRRDQHFPFAAPTGANAGTAQVWVPRWFSRGADSNPRQQYGVAFRYLAEALNNTEFGLFYEQYHNRAPLVSTIRGGTTNAASTSALCRESAVTGCRGEYFAEFPGKVNLYGLSYNTNAPLGIAVQGEYSFRPNQPVQYAPVELLLATLGLANNLTGTGAGQAAAVPLGTRIDGYGRVQMHQFQTTLTKAFGPALGAEQFVLVGEAGANYLDLPEGRLFSGPNTSLPAPGSANAANGSFQTQGGYASRFSWGYRAAARMDFENAIGGASVSPRLSISHDVGGVGPNFNRGAKAATVGLAFNYLLRWQADFAYTNFFGGRPYAGTDTTAVTNPDGSTQPLNYASTSNPLKDRDFISMSVSYAF